MAYYTDPKTGERFALMWRDEVEDGTVRATARAVLQEIGAQMREGDDPDLVSALEAVADRETPDEVFDAFDRLKNRHRDIAEEYRERVRSYNRQIETINKYEREGIMTREHRQDYEAAEEAVERLDGEIDQIIARLDAVREEIKRVGRRLNREIYAVSVLPSSPSLSIPEDPRSTVHDPEAVPA